MMVDRQARKLLFETVAQRVIASADELTDLDRAIGDGDHGINMRRGFEAVVAPPAITLIFVDADMARPGSHCGVIGKDECDVTGLRHDGIGLVRRALAEAVGMDMDIRDDFALRPAH
jgi:hypothetical protein